ncbi:IS110 family transposase [Dissulfurispira thermophila]|uniref:IS110 family transposase n=2 Tax=root TaxID=1 RepID=A0A7G1GY32_9BACT|nr:IS110 family transposase [Dissulfurispira thermophila]BCB95234.1 IS110 family transposase [Dissulfurispira thermophila]BCB95295.1 IS110 family transposase [Dissulfurispira thermophila]BCB96393.1 IS110 family transposase [Dissulfurispira thermophila]
MHGKNYNKQIAKRQRVKRTTLVIGMDIGNEFNAMCLMNKDGEVLGKYSRIYNSRKGFNFFSKIIEAMKKKKGFKDVLIGMEPTGHYWRKIAYFGKDKGYEVRFVRTTALRHQRELDESSSAKSDIRDAVTIANITREGKYIDTVIEDGVFRQLRTLAHVRERIQRYNTGSKHALRAVLDDYFPELNGIFWSMKSKGLWAVLENCPFPEDVKRLGQKELTELIAKSTRRKGSAAKKAAELYHAAKETVGLKQIGIADRYRLKMYLEEVKRSEAQLKDIEEEMKKLLGEVPCAKNILSIPGVGVLSCAVFLGELGNPSNFKSPKQIIKYAGYDPRENDSGQSIGRKRISKKGRWMLRKYLYFMSMRAIHRSKFFSEYYYSKLKSSNRFGQPLKKKEAICAVAIKLIKVIFALLRDNRMFTAKAPALALAA